REFPIVREALQARDHGNGEAGHTDEITGWWLVSDAHAVDSEGRPCVLGTCRPKVRASVFQRTADNGGGNVIGAFLPCARAFPAALANEVIESFANGWWVPAYAGRPSEVVSDVLAQCDDHHAGPELRHAEI